MSKPHLLIVEDEQDISNILKLQLESNNFDVTIIEDGQKALEFIQTPEQDRPGNKEPISLFILDWMLPNTTGLEICKFLRMFKETKTTPILMVTAMTRPEQIIEGLDSGADDYITKPFDINILMARVNSLMRRQNILSSGALKKSEADHLYQIKGLKLDTKQCKSWIDDQELDLTLSEYKLLCTFLQEPGKVMTRTHLVGCIQDGPVHVTERTIDTHIFGLRKKLKNYSDLVETIRGIGYRIIPND